MTKVERPRTKSCNFRLGCFPRENESHEIASSHLYPTDDIVGFVSQTAGVKSTKSCEARISVFQEADDASSGLQVLLPSRPEIVLRRSQTHHQLITAPAHPFPLRPRPVSSPQLPTLSFFAPTAEHPPVTMTTQSTIRESRTVISSSSSSGGRTEGSTSILGGGVGGGVGSDSDFYYKSNISPRNVSVHRASTNLGGGLIGGAGSSYKRTVEISSGHIPSYTAMSSGRVSDVKSTREREKRDMQDLNERFANYIEKVRFLEAQNRKLGQELEDLKGKWGKETSAIKQMYETELTEARGVIDETNKEKSKIEVRMQSLQDQVNDLLRQ